MVVFMSVSMLLWVLNQCGNHPIHEMWIRLLSSYSRLRNPSSGEHSGVDRAKLNEKATDRWFETRDFVARSDTEVPFFCIVSVLWLAVFVLPYHDCYAWLGRHWCFHQPLASPQTTSWPADRTQIVLRSLRSLSTIGKKRLIPYWSSLLGWISFGNAAPLMSFQSLKFGFAARDAKSSLSTWFEIEVEARRIVERHCAW